MTLFLLPRFSHFEPGRWRLYHQSRWALLSVLYRQRKGAIHSHHCQKWLSILHEWCYCFIASSYSVWTRHTLMGKWWLRGRLAGLMLRTRTASKSFKLWNKTMGRIDGRVRLRSPHQTNCSVSFRDLSRFLELLLACARQVFQVSLFS
jgi:hypothetical protein